MSKTRIEPRLLKGFRDYLPQVALMRTEMIQTLQRIFTIFGFAPIDTPALEYSEILLGKGSEETDKQLFRFTDQGGRDVALRFDLTVPLARFAAMHINELGTPFRRYHIAPVWRAEKPQRGRYREFMQCDFDIIGTKSIMADAEIILVINAALTELKIGHRIRLNNRQILNGLLSQLGKGTAGAVVLRAIDKLEKLGAEIVTAELTAEAGLSPGEIEQVFSFLEMSRSTKSNESLIADLKTFFAGNAAALAGVSELEQIIALAAASGMGDELLKIDLSIARGLDYYTGSVFETTLTDMPEIGSICSGGRYNDLASLYTKQELPGVGASIGLDRILGAYEELKRLPEKSSAADIFVSILDAGTEKECLKIASGLRKQGLRTEISSEAGKLGNQLKYAGKKGITYVVILGSTELSKATCSVKNVVSGEQENDISLSGLGDYLLGKTG